MIGESTAEILAGLAEEIDDIKDRDNILQKQEAKIKKERDQIKSEIERLGRVINECGLKEFRTNKYTLRQTSIERYSADEEHLEECLSFLRAQGLFTKYTKVGGEGFPDLVREYKEQGIDIPGIKTYYQWNSKITKG